MRKLYFLILITSFCLPGLAQNLVPNPSFESNSGCPGGIAAVNNWYIVVNHGGSPDAFHTCSGNGATFGAPGNVFGNQAARTGSCYIGFVTRFVSANFREYCQVQLTSPLVAGTTYEAEMYVSLSDGSGHGTGGYQWFFSSTPVTGAGGNGPLTMFTPQAANPMGNHITDQTNWVRISGTFVAAGGEQYLTIGNFFDDAATTFTVVPGWNWNYSYIDDVSVHPAVILASNLLDFQAKWLDKRAVELSWELENPGQVQAIFVERSEGATQGFQEVAPVSLHQSAKENDPWFFADVNANPNRPNYYRLRLIDSDGKTSYSEIREVEAFVPEDYVMSVFPNPSELGQGLNLKTWLAKSGSLKVGLYDLSGKLLRSWEPEGQAGENHIQLNTQGLEAGFFLLRVNGGQIQHTERVSIR
ncbi:MAG: T9SS type A sorting domain-containing protein [Bacteroidia bacterium]|nr:T9SS type A sorting domain-containing protein [Bacteroidia bacterium]